MGTRESAAAPFPTPSMELHSSDCLRRIETLRTKSCHAAGIYDERALARVVDLSIAESCNRNAGIVFLSLGPHHLLPGTLLTPCPQFGPTPISTSSGTASEYACSMCSRTSGFIVSTSLSGTSKTSSSCTVKSSATSGHAGGFLVNADHRELDESRPFPAAECSRGALGKAALIWILAVDVGNGANASEQGRYFLLARACSSVASMNARTPNIFEIGVDEFLRLAGRDANCCDKPKADSHRRCEVHHFAARRVRRHHQRRHAKNLRRGQG